MKPEQPEHHSLEHVLETLSYHLVCLASDRPMPGAPDQDRVRFGLGLGCGGTGGPSIYVREIIIRPSSWDTDPWGPWAQVTFDGRSVGNRHGAAHEYARLCAPVIAYAAAHAATAATAARPKLRKIA